MKKGKLMAGFITLLVVIGMLGLAGCTPTYTQDELNTQVQTAQNNVKTSYEAKLSTLQAECISTVEKLNMETSNLNTDIADFQKAKAELEASNDVKGEEVAELASKIAVLEAQLVEVELACATAEDICELIKDVSLNTDFADTLTDNDMIRLLDTQIEFDGGKIDVHEELVLTTDVEVTTSELGDDEFGDEPYMTINADEAVVYKYVFDDDVFTSDISANESLKIVFLGEELEIIFADTNMITIVKGDKYMLEEGETKTLLVNGKEVVVTAKIISDYTNPDVKLVINGEMSRAMHVGESDDVGDYYIYISEVLANEAGETSGGDILEFRIWDDEIQYDIVTGESFDEDLDLWEYEINVTADKLVSISLFNSEKYYRVDDETPAFAINEYMSLPNNYINFGIMSLEEAEYVSVNIGFDGCFGPDGVPVLLLEADGDYFSVGTDEVSKVGFDGFLYIYKDSDNEWQNTSTLTVEYEDTTFEPTIETINMTGFECSCENVSNPTITEVCTNETTSPEWNCTNTSTSTPTSNGIYTFGEISINANIDASRLGTNAKQVDIDDVVINGKNFSTTDTDVLTTAGFVVKNIEDNVEEDEVVVEMPSGVVIANICFK